ncbi:MAG: recombinase RecA [Firmicutes bacterium]|nr:recombinase RecA [[Eubacterium] siraeum]MCM1487273.1 recombinase RecA [Bacillota bacterium]
MSAPEERQKALDNAIACIVKTYGEGSVMIMGSQKSKLKVEVVSTGSLGLDLALGIGGLPRGRIVEIFGPESGGKTTVSLQAIAEVQKKGGIAAFMDVEHALDPVYARQLGVDVDQLIVSQPDTGEQALEIMEMLVRSGAIDIIVLDSVAAMATRAEIEGEMGDSFVGVQARLMSQAMRKLTSAISQTSTVAVFINQVREKIGVMYGNPETTPGGRALKFYASVRIEVRSGEQLKEGDKVIGRRTKCKVVKNKVAPPFTTCEFDMIFGEGISKLGEIVDMAVELDIIKKSGSWFSYQDMKVGQGRESVKKWLQENSDILDEVEAKIRAEADSVFKKQMEGKAEEEPDKTPDGAAADKAEEQREAKTEEKEAKSSKKAAAKSKKKPVMEADTDFEEFSIEEVDDDK